MRKVLSGALPQDLTGKRILDAGCGTGLASFELANRGATVLATDKVLVIEATLSNGDIIDPFTGVKPVLDSVDYNVLWHDHNQFWRKFSSRVTKKGRKNILNRFETWLKRYNNTYFDDNLYGNRIREVKIWSVSQRNKDINSKANYRVSKRLLNSKQSSKSKVKPINKNQGKK